MTHSQFAKSKAKRVKTHSKKGKIQAARRRHQGRASSAIAVGSLNTRRPLVFEAPRSTQFPPCHPFSPHFCFFPAPTTPHFAPALPRCRVGGRRGERRSCLLRQKKTRFADEGPCIAPLPCFYRGLNVKSSAKSQQCPPRHPQARLGRRARQEWQEEEGESRPRPADDPAPAGKAEQGERSIVEAMWL
jgi:hypothetical protein